MQDQRSFKGVVNYLKKYIVTFKQTKKDFQNHKKLTIIKNKPVY